MAIILNASSGAATAHASEGRLRERFGGAGYGIELTLAEGEAGRPGWFWTELPLLLPSPVIADLPALDAFGRLFNHLGDEDTGALQSSELGPLTRLGDGEGRFCAVAY